jgi:hypothetical protein
MIGGVVWGLGGFVACAVFGPSLPVAIAVTVVTAIVGALRGA